MKIVPIVHLCLDGENSKNEIEDIDISETTYFLLSGGKIVKFDNDQINKIGGVYIDEKGYLLGLYDVNKIYYQLSSSPSNEIGLNENNQKIYEKAQINGNFISFSQIEKDNENNGKYDESVTAKEIQIANDIRNSYNLSDNSKYKLLSISNQNIVNCEEGISIVSKLNGNLIYMPLTKEECEALCTGSQIDVENTCDENLFYTGKNGLIVDNQSVGEKSLYKLNALIQKQNYASNTDFKDSKVLGDPQYIYEGVKYGTTDPIFKGSVSEELNKKMAYLELSSGYKFYTMFFERPCTYQLTLANESARTFFEESDIDSSKGILCLVIKGKDDQKTTIGLAFGQDVPGEIQSIVRQQMGGIVSEKEFDFTQRLIATYYKIPKKRHVVNFFIQKISDEEKQAHDKKIKEMEDEHRSAIFGVEMNDVLMGNIRLEHTVENSAEGAAVAVRYFICDPISEKAIYEVYFPNEELKEEYVFSEAYIGVYEPGFSIDKLKTKNVGFNNALKAGWKYGNFDPCSYVFGIEGKTFVPTFGTFFDYYYTLRPSASEEIRNLVTDATLGFATIAVPVKYIIYPTSAAIAIYMAQDRPDMALSYLAGYGLVKGFQGISALYTFVKPSMIQMKSNLRVLSFSLKLDANVSKGLVSESQFASANRLFEKPLVQAEVVEYIIPKSIVSNNVDDVGNYVIKATLKKDGSEVLVGSILNDGKEITLLGYTDDYSRVTSSTKITDDVLKLLADDVAKNSGQVGKLLDDIVDETKFVDLVKDIKYLPGPELPLKIAETFEKGVYINRQLKINEKLFKYHGINNRTGKKYSWFTNKKYATEEELRQQLAIRNDWGVQIEYVTEFNVPAGTWVSEGKAAAQGIGYPGGGSQAVITNTPNAWIVRTDKAFK
ncbi:hypothetical protein D0T56_16410 [Dysgonomonas sp. 520]|nr:hypothetical protein [Dysgonomonas sp. 520]